MVGSHESLPAHTHTQANPYHFLDFLGITLAFQDYWRDSMNETLYLTENRFLPQLNNELPAKNGSYKAHMISLNKLVLVEATEDTIVYPYQSEQFGGYEWGTTVCGHVCDGCRLHALEC